ncbi:substrate-binding domain-containing protein [Flavobacterium algicola]|nr:substrate-binding domain-containing protein [Flavobacterium algicola]
MHKRGHVAQENVDKVNAIIKEHGYKRNVFASNLAFNKKFVFAVFLPKYDTIEYWHNQIKGIEKAEQEYRNLGVVLDYYFYDFDSTSFKNKASEVLKSNFDGILFAPIFHDESVLFLEECQKKQVPIVMVDANIETSIAHTYVGQDAFKSGVLAGKLISFAVKSERRVLVVKIAREIETTSVYLQRIAGFYSFFEKNKNLEHFKFTELTIKDSGKELLNVNMFAGIHSVFVPNSRAYMVAQFLEANHIVGIRIIGYDLLELNKEYLKKGIIDFLIHQKPEIQGYTAIGFLYKQLVLQEPVPQTQYMPLEIIVKENLE